MINHQCGFWKPILIFRPSKIWKEKRKKNVMSHALSKISVKESLDNKLGVQMFCFIQLVRFLHAAPAHFVVVWQFWHLKIQKFKSPTMLQIQPQTFCCISSPLSFHLYLSCCLSLSCIDGTDSIKVSWIFKRKRCVPAHLLNWILKRKLNRPECKALHSE